MGDGIGHRLLFVLIEKDKKRKEEYMIQTITIGGKPYEMKSNLRIYETYKNMFGKELAPTISEINKKLTSLTTKDENGNVVMNENTDSLSVISYATREAIKIAWVMIKELDNNFKSLEQWQSELDDDLVGSWVSEVLVLAYAPFHNRKLPQDHKQPATN